MTTKHVFITLSCLLLLVMAGQSDAVRAQLLDREWHKTNFRAGWDGGRGAIWSNEQVLQLNPGFRAALGISDEYYEEILSKAYAGTVGENPEYRKANQEYEEAFRVLTGSEPYMNTAYRRLAGDEEAFNRLEKAGARKSFMEQEFQARRGLGHRTGTFEDALSPELKQKILEAQLAAAIEESNISLPTLFIKTLNLTESQREGVERIKKELEPEFEKYLEIFANNRVLGFERSDAMRSQRPQRPFVPFNTREEFKEWWRKNHEESMTYNREFREDPEYKRLEDEINASRKALITLFRTRVFEILTDEQRKQLQDLIDNPPPHARYFIQRARGEIVIPVPYPARYLIQSEI